jgi:hypothetical protein
MHSKIKSADCLQAPTQSSDYSGWKHPGSPALFAFLVKLSALIESSNLMSECLRAGLDGRKSGTLTLVKLFSNRAGVLLKL